MFNPINDKKTKFEVINTFNLLKAFYPNACDDMLFYRAYWIETKCTHEENYSAEFVFNGGLLIDYEM